MSITPSEQTSVYRQVDAILKTEDIYGGRQVSIHISVFVSDGMYSVLIILCNYLQMINQIALFMKKKIF